MTKEPSASMELLAKLIGTDDADGIRTLGATDAALKADLNNQLPGGHFGATPLLAAANRGNLAVIDALLEIGADINARSHWWAGSFGVLDGKPEIARHMIARGATVDINAAAHLGMLDRVRQLLDADQSLANHRGGDGQTPLHVAATVEIADLLLDRGADVNARDIDHESTAAQYAVKDRIDVARRLVERGSETDILLACAIGDLELVRKLVNADRKCLLTSVSDACFPKKDPESGGCIYIWTLGWNKTPQQVAKAHGHLAIVRFLQERSPVEVNLIDACMNGDRSMLDAILSSHPDLKTTFSSDFYSRIVAAAMDRNVAGLRLMLDLGIPAGAANPSGETALHWASFHGDPESASVLLQAGAPVDVVENTFKARPLGWAMYGSLHGWYAKSGDYAGVVKLLLDAGAKPALESLKDGDASAAVIEVLRKHGGDS